MSIWTKGSESGVLFKDWAGDSSGGSVGISSAGSAESKNAPAMQDGRNDSHRLAFAGLFAFTLLLYIRPNDLFPGALAWLPLAKLVAIGTLLAYTASKLSAGERFTVLPIELKMVLVMVGLAVLFLPIAVDKQASINRLTEDFLKVAVVFLLMVNLMDTRHRLLSILRLVVVCGTFIAVATISSHAVDKLGQELTQDGTRVEGAVGGIFGNPNDLAISLDLLLPIALALALSRKGTARMFYLGCSFILAFGVAVTFSRGGFLGLVAMGGVFVWKVGRRSKLIAVLAAVLACGAFASVVPNGYSERLLTIVHTDQDQTNSAQQRRELLGRAVEVASNHLVLGVGMGNFPVYSIHNKLAHNSYLETSAELGVAGLIAYLVVIVSPLRRLRGMEKRYLSSPDPDQRELYFMSIGIQAAIASYMVCSFFGSVQYQWFIYYIAAYGISLRRLEERTSVMRGSLETAPLTATVPGRAGVVWSSQQTIRSVASADVNSNWRQQ
jgi:putative inorganic carbon (HCO3(-)) transporter